MQPGARLSPTELAALGVRGLNPKNVAGSITVEAPVSLNGSKTSGTTVFGMMTYCVTGCVFKDAIVGRFCSIASDVSVGASEHPTDWLSTHPFQFDGTRQFSGHRAYDSIVGRQRFTSAKTTRIGNDVWIGERAFISRGVTVGDGAVIAAGAVVVHDVAPYTIVGGVPARVIRPRFAPDVVQRLLNLKWWDRDLAGHTDHLDFSHALGALEYLEHALSAGDLGRVAPLVLSLRTDGAAFALEPS